MFVGPVFISADVRGYGVNMRKLFPYALVLSAGCSATVETQQPPPPSDSGAPADDRDASVPDAAPPATACIESGKSCEADENGCCQGAICTYDPNNPAKRICADTCLNNSQCKSGCCATLTSGTAKVCGPVEYCATTCAQAGGDCSIETGSECCPNSVCVVSTVDGTRCAARCLGHAQCQSGCCAPLSNTGELVCSPATFCGG